MRTFLGKSDFYWPLMVLAEQRQCSLYANVLSVQSSVPAMFLHFFANGRVTNRRASVGRLIFATTGGAAPVKTSAGNNFPRKYQRIASNYYQYW